jgi:hypothetical protein
VSVELLASMPDSGWTALYPDHARGIHLFTDRSYGQAEYLLDPANYRRIDSRAQRERTLPYRVIYGDEYFADHATGGQGISWRCSTAGFLDQAAETIDALDVATVRREFSVAEMYALGIYKVHETDDDDQTFERVLTNLRWLADLYRHIARDGLDLIIETD